MGRSQVKKVFWGVLFLLGALALLLGKSGYLEGVGFWTVFFSIILAGILIDGILRVSFGEILFPLAGLIIIHDELLHMEAITPWPVLGAALLGTIGLHIIFPRRGKWKKIGDYASEGTCQYGVEDDERLSGDKIRYEVSFGSAIKYVSGKDVSRVFLESSFGSLEVYFNDAELKDHEVKVCVDCSFGNMELYVPAEWNLVINVDNSFGGVEESGHGNPNGENTLYVSGEVSFGHMIIHHI